MEKTITCMYDAIAGSDTVVTFGWNEHGICGTGTEANIYAPYVVTKPLEGQRATLIGCGAGHTLLLAGSK